MLFATQFFGPDLSPHFHNESVRETGVMNGKQIVQIKRMKIHETTNYKTIIESNIYCVSITMVLQVVSGGKKVIAHVPNSISQSCPHHGKP